MTDSFLSEPIEFFYQSKDGEKIYAKYWTSAKEKPRGVIQVAHGLGETADYYREFSMIAVGLGFAVYISEARGHGKTAGNIELPEYGEKAGNIGADGFRMMRDDLHALTLIIKAQHQDVPVFLLGHSMGSVVARLYSFEYGSEIKGLINTGAPFDSIDTGYLLQVVEKEIKEYGLKVSSRETFNELFSNVNQPFEPVETQLDWITSDKEMIRESLNLPYTYIPFNNEFYKYFLLALIEIQKDVNINSISKRLPILLISGDKDVVTGYGSDISAQSEKYKQAGIEDVQVKIYKDKRHSILREVNREEVTYDILNWIISHIADQ